MAAAAVTQTPSVAPAADQACLLYICMHTQHAQEEDGMFETFQTYLGSSRKGGGREDSSSSAISYNNTSNLYFLTDDPCHLVPRLCQTVAGVQAVPLEEDSCPPGAEANDTLQQALQDGEVGLYFITLGCLMHITLVEKFWLPAGAAEE